MNSSKIPLGLAIIAVAFMAFGGFFLPADDDAEIVLQVEQSDDKKTYSITGSVTDTDGYVISGVNVTLYYDNEKLTAKTNNNGQFAFNYFQSESNIMDIEFGKEGYKSVYIEKFNADEQRSFPVKLQKADTTSHIIWTILIMVIILILIAAFFIYKVRTQFN